MYSIILCGGSGTRLWPLSRKNYPKQFLKLYSDRSLIQETFLRMREIMPADNIFFVTNKDGLFNVLNQIREVEKGYKETQVLVEPASLNTAPAITLAIKHLVEKEGASLDAPVIILPSDHFIGNSVAYINLVKNAMQKINGYIGTIGITPTKAETGYGYIKKGAHFGDFHQVEEFKEKPNKETAEQYLASGQYAWNSGMYLFTPRTYVQELKKHTPEIYSHLTKSLEDFLKDFLQMPSISIDYAISEKSDKVVVFEGEFGWSDIGSFDSLAEILETEGNGKHISIDSNNIFVHSASNRLVATLGVDDLSIIETADSILVKKRGRGEDVKMIVDYMKSKKTKELDYNLVGHRPWGKYEVLIDHPAHKVKKITVYPGGKLSLQSHYHRAEHWVVVKGLAKIVHGDKEIFLKENESTFIPVMTTHRLENPGKVDLELIEVQTGHYLEEDDIIRFEDVYNRLEEKK